jgi:hypothetical protein
MCSIFRARFLLPPFPPKTDKRNAIKERERRQKRRISDYYLFVAEGGGYASFLVYYRVAIQALSPLFADEEDK